MSWHSARSELGAPGRSVCFTPAAAIHGMRVVSFCTVTQSSVCGWFWQVDQMSKLATALGISANKEGDAFNRDLQVRLQHCKTATMHQLKEQ